MSKPKQTAIANGRVYFRASHKVLDKAIQTIGKENFSWSWSLQTDGLYSVPVEQWAAISAIRGIKNRPVTDRHSKPSPLK